MKAGDIVIAPEGCKEYLTARKEYMVIKCDNYGGDYGSFFYNNR